MKKIIYCVTKSNFGGTQKYIFDLATNLPKDEFEVVVLFGGHGALETKLKAKNIRTISLGSLERDINVFKEIHVFFSLLKTFITEKPDIVHLNSSKIGGTGSLAARCARIPNIIFTAHGWHFKEKRSGLVRFITYVLSWFTVLFSYTTITVSEDDYKRAQSFPLIANKVTTIHNGIVLPDYVDMSTARSRLAEHLAIPLETFNSKTIVVSIGELTANKGFKYAIPAFEKLNDHIYIIIGSGEDHIQLNNLINQYRLHDRVFLAGNIADAQLLIPAADIFLMPSIKEGLPYVLLEAGGAGASVIATDVGGIPEIISDEETGRLIKPQSTHAIIQKLKAPDQPQYGTALKQRIQARFSFDTMLQKTERLY